MENDTLCRDLPGGYYAPEYPLFFPRQLITPDDLNLILEYFRNKMRRHNRLLHGWGVVCGAKVCPVVTADGSPEPWKVKVTPGYILGPYGDEILIDCERTMDLRSTGVTGVTGEPCMDAPDPWCSEVFVPCEQTGPQYIAVKYKEIKTRPVKVQPVGCGCDDTQCEYSRWRDGYEIGILRETPESCGAPNVTQFEQLTQGGLPECPPCPNDPWVVLAAVEVQDDGVIKYIDNCSCRRLVVSLSHFWWKCSPAGKVQIDGITVSEGDTPVNDPKNLSAGKSFSITVMGKNFSNDAKVNLGSGIQISDSSTSVDGQKIQFTATIDENAQPGPRSLIITNPDCSAAVSVEAIGVTRAETKQ